MGEMTSTLRFYDGVEWVPSDWAEMVEEEFQYVRNQEIAENIREKNAD